MVDGNPTARRRRGRFRPMPAAVGVTLAVLASPAASQPLPAVGAAGQAGYGALAVGGQQGHRYGWAVNEATQEAADARARAKCGEDCRVVMRFSNACAAYAADQTRGSTAFGWARGARDAQVRELALDACRSHGGTACTVRVWACTGRTSS